MNTNPFSHFGGRFLAAAAVLLSLATAAVAEEATFVVDSVAIRKSPLEIPYYIFVEVVFKDQKAAMDMPVEVNQIQGMNEEITVPLALSLKSIPEREWATVTLRMDTDKEKVKTFEAAYSDSAKVPMISTSTKPTVVMPQEGLWEYVLRWHTDGL